MVAAADADALVATDADEAPAGLVVESAAAPKTGPRTFRAKDEDWIATHAGRGAGGTGRLAHARLEAVRFARAVEPELVAAEVLVPHARLDDLYDDELAELLERGLRSQTGKD